MLKKVAFSTLSPNVGEDFNSSANKNGVLNKKKSSKKNNDEEYSLRFEIVLSQYSSSNNNDCPEFSYREMVKDAERKNNLPQDLESVYERNEEAKMQEMAKRFEAKYAPKKKRKNDFIDKGAGYDDNDSFIDNDEAYDELIPSTLTTKYGGFYINSGKLEFRQCSDNEDDEMVSENDDDSIDFRTASKKRKNKSNNSFNNTKRQKKVIESEDSKSNDNSRDLDDEEEDESESDEESSDDSSDSDDNQPQPQSAKSTVKKKSNGKQQLNPIQIDSIIESVINKNFANDIVTDRDDPHKIPDDLIGSLQEKLNQLKNMKLNLQDKKQRFFSDDVNKILLSIESLLQSNGSSKNKVISWLTSYLQVTRETLLKRIKSTKKVNEESKLRENVKNLRAEVSYLVPDYEEFEANKTKRAEDKRNGVNVAEEPVEEFKLVNDKIKDLLKKIYSAKRILVELENIKGKDEELNITNFFNNEIRTIWPKDCISNESLLKTAGFISKYNNKPSDSNKSSVSVINNKKTQSQQNNNGQPLNLNTSKLSQQQQSSQSQQSSINNSLNSSKIKQQPKDLSIEKTTTKDHNNKSESLLAKKHNDQTLKSRSDTSPSLSKHHSFIKQEINKQYGLDDNHQKQFTIDQFSHLNKSANNIDNLIQQQLNQRMKEQQHKHHQQKKLAQQFAQQQQLATQHQQQQKLSQSKNSSFDTPQNLTNQLSAHNSSLSLNSSINRPQSSSTPNHNSSLSNKKYIESQIAQQRLFSQTTSTPNQHNNNKTLASTSSKQQSISKSPLDVDYKFEKAIQKSFEESNKQQSINQYQCSNSFSNPNSMNPQSSQSIAPKPAHSNNSTPATQPNSVNMGLFNHPQQHLIHQLAIKQLEQLYLQQQQQTNNPRASSMNSYSGNYGNYTGNNSINQQSLSTQQPQINSQSFSGSNSSNIVNSSSINFKQQTQQQINTVSGEIKNEFDNIMSNRFHSPSNQVIGYQPTATTELTSHMTSPAVIHQQQQIKATSSIYPDYQTMNSQRQLYQLSTNQQRQDDPNSKRK